jgi:hypothetical protein
MAASSTSASWLLGRAPPIASVEVSVDFLTARCLLRPPWGQAGLVRDPGDERELRSPTPLHLSEHVLLELHHGADLHERPLRAGAHHVAGLAHDHQAARLGLGEIDAGLGRGLRLVSEWLGWREPMREPLLAQHALAPAPGLERLVDARDVRRRVAGHGGYFVGLLTFTARPGRVLPGWV